MEAAFKWFIAAMIAAWISLSAAVQFLLIFMAFDYVTGIVAAYVNKELCSEKGAKGLAKKVAVLLLVWVSHYATRAINVDYDLGAWVATAYSINELISIIENCRRAGVPVPQRLVDALMKAKTVWDGTERRADTETQYSGPERRAGLDTPKEDA